MKPIEFKEQNTVYGKGQENYNQLPAHLNTSYQGEVTTCWKLSLKERLKLLFTGRVYLCLITFNKPISPSNMSVNKKDFIQTL